MKISDAYTLLLLLALPCLMSCGSDTTNQGKENMRDSQNTKKVLPAAAVNNALPFTLEFEEKNYADSNPLPCLQSYQIAVSQAGYWLMLGGRRQGLHTFNSAPANNFIKDSANNFIYVINPVTSQYWSFDVNTLSPDLSAPLQSTDQQSYYDRQTDNFYLVGGYGWNAGATNMLTFNSIIRFRLEDMVKAVMSSYKPSQVQTLFQIGYSDSLAVTGGQLFSLNANFYLVFGQKFMGQYRAFGGNDFTQQYTEEVRTFNLVPNTLTINSYGANTNTENDHPFHRRDGNSLDDIDPSTGNMRITAYGGVFKPGIIAPYNYPVYINNPSAPVVDTTCQQKFSQYSCPVISVYDSSANSSVYHTFYGGISHYYYAQTDSQRAVFDTVTAQGRNDGFPFIADVTTLQHTADGTYHEFIQVNPIQDNRLLGTTANFILLPDLIKQGVAYSNGVIKLTHIPPGTRLLIGYIYGGIEAQNPLPLIPNTGTFVTNSVFGVYLTNTPSAAIPASEGHASVISNAMLNRR